MPPVTKGIRTTTGVLGPTNIDAVIADAKAAVKADAPAKEPVKARVPRTKIAPASFKPAPSNSTAGGPPTMPKAP